MHTDLFCNFIDWLFNCIDHCASFGYNDNICHSSITLATKLQLYQVFILFVILCGAKTWSHPLNNCRETSMHFICVVFVAYCEFPGGTAFQMKTSADILTSHHSHTSAVPLVSSSLATLHVLIHPWTTAEHSDPVWPPYQGTGTSDHADLVKLGSAQLNLMPDQLSLHLKLVWQFPVIEHKIGRRGGHSWKR